MTQNQTNHGQNSELTKGRKQAALFESDEDLDNLLNGAFEQSSESLKDDVTKSEFEFRPLTKGLGFHQEKRNQKPALRGARPQKSSPIPQSKTQNTGAPQRSAPQAKRRENSYALKNDLSAFYGESVVTPEEEKSTQNEAPSDLQETVKNPSRAGLAKMFGAYLIDLMCIVGFYAAMVASVVMVSGLAPQELLELFTISERMTFAISLFTLIYLFYFSVLDLGGTIGKSLLGLSVQKTDQSRLTIYSTFTRSLVSLFSLLLAGFPMAFDFQGKLSDTEVVKK